MHRKHSCFMIIIFPDEILILSGKFTGLDSFRRDDYVCYRKRPEGKRFSLEGPFILSDVNFDVKIRAKMDLKVTKIPVDADVTGNLTYLRTYMSVDVDTDNQTINFSKWIVQRQTGYNLDINYKHSWGLINYIANSLIKINLVEGWVNELVQKLIVREYFAKMFKVEKAVSRESECDSVPNVLPEIPTDEKEKIKSKWASLV